MIVQMAREVSSGDLCIVGAGSVLPAVVFALARTFDVDAWVVTMNGGFVPIEAFRLGVLDGDIPLARCAASWLSAATTVAGFERILCERALEFLRPAQIDASGRVNNSLIVRTDGSRIQLPGGAGIPSALGSRRRIRLYTVGHDHRTFRIAADAITGSVTDLAKQSVLIYTPLAVLAIEPAGPRVVTRYEGVTLDELKSATPFDLHDIEQEDQVPSASPAERELLGAVDPLGLRYLEALPVPERLDRIRALGHGDER
jgi:acyl CoA:acetate/3-ketoacid CoA transferase beta subunit